MQMQESVRYGVTVVRLFGEFDAASAPAVEARIESLALSKAGCVVLDFTGVPFMSSAGLRVLQKAQRTAKANGGEIRLAALGQPVQAVLNQTGMAALFKTFPSVDAALADVRVAELGDEEIDQAVSVLSLSGDLDAAAAPELERSLRERVQAGSTRLVLDMSRVNFITSAALRVLQATLMGVRGRQGDIRLVGVQPEVRKVFDLLGFTPLFKAYATVDDAVVSYDVE